MVKIVNFYVVYIVITIKKCLIWRLNEVTHVKHHHSAQDLVDEFQKYSFSLLPICPKYVVTWDQLLDNVLHLQGNNDRSLPYYLNMLPL